MLSPARLITNFDWVWHLTPDVDDHHELYNFFHVLSKYLLIRFTIRSLFAIDATKWHGYPPLAYEMRIQYLMEEWSIWHFLWLKLSSSTIYSYSPTTWSFCLRLPFILFAVVQHSCTTNDVPCGWIKKIQMSDSVKRISCGWYFALTACLADSTHFYSMICSNSCFDCLVVDSVQQ